jgi:YD repeat-containing protein
MKKHELKEKKDYIELLENGKTIYYRDLKSGCSYEWTYDGKDKQLTYKDIDGFSFEFTYDKLGNVLTYKNHTGYSEKYTYDDRGNVLTKTVNGKLVIDNRKVTIELTQEQLDKIKHLI